MSNDGKYLEHAVEVELRKYKQTRFFWRRLYDAAAARSKLPAQPSDFFLSFMINDSEAVPIHLECKSVGKKTRRLDKGSFSQLADMKRWSKAGVQGFVLIHFHELDIFCVEDVDNMEFGVPSWVIRGRQYLTLPELIKDFMERWL